MATFLPLGVAAGPPQIAMHALALVFCSGSLGQGLSVAAGCVSFLWTLWRGERVKKVFVLGDVRSCRRASNWEACMFAAHQKLPRDAPHCHCDLTTAD